MDIQQFNKKFQFGKAGFIGGEEELFFTKNGKLFPCFLDVLKLAGESIGIDNGNWLGANRALNSTGKIAIKDIEQKLGIKPELPLAQGEIITGKLTSSNQMIEIAKQRRKILNGFVRRLGGKLCFDPAPEVSRKDFQVFPLKRYVDIKEKYGQAALAGFISGFHIHYSVGSKEKAIQALNHLSPIILKEFADFYSIKRLKKYYQLAGEKNFLPPKIEGWNHYFRVMEKLLPNQGALHDPTKCWWLVRVHPNGTIELRIIDVMEDLDKLKKAIDLFVNLIKKIL